MPSFVYLSADPCDGRGGRLLHSGSSTTTGTPTDPTVAAGDAFLRKVVPGILRSKAYRCAGALVVLFSGVSRSQAGTATGALVLSPFVRAGSTDRHTTNAYGVLRTLERVFGVNPLALAE